MTPLYIILSTICSLQANPIAPTAYIDDGSTVSYSYRFTEPTKASSATQTLTWGIQESCIETYRISTSSAMAEGESVAFRLIPTDELYVPLQTMSDVCEWKKLAATLTTGITCSNKSWKVRKLKRVEVDWEERP